MCDYLKQNNCSITGEICPYTYWCDRLKIWKPSKSMPNNCRVKEEHETPKGQYRVCMCQKGFLFIIVDNASVKLKNPFGYVPKYVKLSKTKNGWKIRK